MLLVVNAFKWVKVCFTLTMISSVSRAMRADSVAKFPSTTDSCSTSALVLHRDSVYSKLFIVPIWHTHTTVCVASDYVLHEVDRQLDQHHSDVQWKWTATKRYSVREERQKDTLVHSVCVLSPVSDILPPADVLLTSVRTALWGTHRNRGEWQNHCFDIYSHRYQQCIRCTSAATDHLLSCSDGAQYGLLQTGLHVLRLLKGQTVYPLQGFLPLRRGTMNRIIKNMSTCNTKRHYIK